MFLADLEPGARFRLRLVPKTGTLLAKSLTSALVKYDSTTVKTIETDEETIEFRAPRPAVTLSLGTDVILLAGRTPDC